MYVVLPAFLNIPQFWEKSRGEPLPTLSGLAWSSVLIYQTFPLNFSRRENLPDQPASHLSSVLLAYLNDFSPINMITKLARVIEVKPHYLMVYIHKS